MLCTEALDACEELADQKAGLEHQLPDLEKRVQILIAQIKQPTVEYEQVRKAIEKAERELAETRGRHAKEEKELDTFRKKAEAEKQRINKKSKSVTSALM